MGNTVAEMRIKAKFDSDGLEKDVPKLKAKLKNIAEKLKLTAGSTAKTVGLLFKEAFKGLASILSGVLGYLLKIGSLAIGIFAGGIFGMAFKEALKDSESLRGNLQYIKAMLQTGINNIIQALLPTIQKLLNGILNTIYTILNYVNYITMAWFGLDLFAGTDDTFKKNMADASKSASKIKKELQLAPFDEINKLSDNKDSGSSGSSTSFGTPDLKDMSKTKMPEWIKWIADNKEFIEKMALTVAGIFGAETIAGWISNIGKFLGSGELSTLGSTLGNLGLIAGGIMITKICADYIWEDLQKLHDDIIEISDSTEKGLKKWLDSEPDIDAVFSTWHNDINVTAERYKGVKAILWDILGLVDVITGKEDSRLYLAQQQTKEASLLIDYMVEEYNKGELNNKQQKKIIKSLVTQRQENDGIITRLKQQGKDTSAIEQLNEKLDAQLFAVSKGIEYNESSTKLWEDAQKGVSDEALQTKDTIDIINGTQLDDKTVHIYGDETDYANTVNYIESKSHSVTVDVDGNTDKLRESIITAITGALGSFKFKSSGASVGIGAYGLGYLAGKTLKDLFKLANGGIVNNPGAGVPIASNVIAGEKGAEAVIPLNEDVYDKLGKAIAKHVRIDNTIDFSIDSYRLNRIMKQSSANNNFAMNR